MGVACRSDIGPRVALSGEDFVPHLSNPRGDNVSAPMEIDSIRNEISNINESLQKPLNVAKMIESCYMNNSFWSTFSLVKSLPNGHCIMSSIVSCLNRLHSTEYRFDSLIENLIHECKNFERYQSYYVDGFQTFHSEMQKYVYNRCYDSLFCELVPSIMANALNHIIVVINNDTAAPDTQVNVYDFIPMEYENKNPICVKCERKLGILVLLRRSNHYDACVQTTTYSNPCSCYINPFALSKVYFPSNTQDLA